MKVTRLFDLLEQFRHNPQKYAKMVIASKQNGKWREYSTSDYIEYANNFSYGLLAKGIKKGDKIATITNNRVEWNFVDMGIMQTGAAHVPIYTTISNEEFLHILSHCDAKFVFVSDKNLYGKIKTIAEKIPHIQDIYTFDEVPEAKSWTEIIELGKKSAVYFNAELQKIKDSITENDVASIIYTSGTTGLSKGVMLSHRNLVSNAYFTAKINHLKAGEKALSFLPLSHVFEHLVNYQYHNLGVSIYYAESVATIASDIKDLQVHGFIAVPRLLESIYEKIQQKAKKLSPAKRAIFNWAINVASKYEPFEKKSIIYNIKHKIADKLVFSKWREALSKNVTFIGCGGAALRPQLTRIFWAAGLPVFEGYGLTETSPVIAVNYNKPGKIKSGTVGTLVEGCEVKIAADGEIITRGPNIMLGYYKDIENTNKVIDSEGWFHTGDIGELIDGKYLKITDRKKEIFKMSNGKYIAPQTIENKLKESFFIGQSMIVGENQKFAGVIISPNFNQLREWCNAQKIHFKDHKELVKSPKVVAHFQKEIERFNKNLGQFEQIRKFKLVHDEWSTQTGELSPTLKLRRKVIYERYKELVDKMYSH